VLEETKNETVKGISRGWFKNGPYVVAVDSFLVIIGGMDEKQHQFRVGSEERMLDDLIEFEG
jgi:hypothetical protein